MWVQMVHNKQKREVELLVVIPSMEYLPPNVKQEHQPDASEDVGVTNTIKKTPDVNMTENNTH